jgi:hypothetical protein
MDSVITLVKAALKSIVGKHLPVRISTHSGLHPTLTLGQQAGFTIEVKPTVLKNVTGLLAHWPHPTGQPWVLFTSYVGEDAGRELRRQGLCYADTAGNAWLHHPEAELYILVEGRPRPPKASPAGNAAAGRAFRKSGLRVLFHLLNEPELVRQPYRTIGERTATPAATVGLIMIDLQQQGYLVGEEPRQLRRREELIRRWVEGYGDTLRPRLPAVRYRWVDAQAATGGWQRLPLGATTWWGGEPAVNLLLDGYLLPEFFTLYSAATRPALMRQLRLVPDPAGNVEVWPLFDQRLGFTSATSRCVPPLLVYADLLLSGDARSREAADKLYARYLQHSA